MMRKKNPDEKKRIFDFYYTELSAIAEYFEKQELEGYRLEEFDRNIMIFKKCPPRKIRYCAEIFRGSAPDEFIESCALEGWKLAAQYNDELYIFRTQKADAIDIMSDRKEKMKICSRRILRQPGTWISLIYALANIIRFILYVNVGVGITLFETDVFNYIALVLISILIFITLIKVFDYFLWQFTAFRGEETSRFFSLKNTIRKRKIYSFVTCIFLLVGYIVLAWISPEFFLSKLVIGIYLIVTFGFSLHFELLKLNFNKKDNIKKTVLSCIVVLCIVGGAFSISEYAERTFTENQNTIFNKEDIPISLMDLGVKAKSFEDEGDVQSTRFGQMYNFISDAKLKEENGSGYLAYSVLVSDYPYIRQKYINKILEKYNDYEYELVKVTPPETEWDFYYKVKSENANEYDGFAVKDNVVVYLRWPVECEKNFFEVAYEKLFTE